MRILSWNVNGLRARIGYGFEDTIRALGPDIVCLSEVRAKPEQLPKNLFSECGRCGFRGYFSIHDRAGYAGTTIFVREDLGGTPIFLGDFPGGFENGRAAILEYDRFNLISLYSPNVGRAGEKCEHRGAFEEHLRSYVRTSSKPVIICGDLNVAPGAIDTNVRSVAGTTPTERRAFSDLLSLGLSDVFRTRNPATTQYTWFSNQYNSRANNRGMRIDHFVVSDCLLDKVQDMFHVYEDSLICKSDHVPIVMDIDINI